MMQWSTSVWPKDPVSANITNDNSQAEIDGMRREMESMRNYLMTSNQKTQDRSELEEYKRQLWLYEMRRRLFQLPSIPKIEKK